MHRLFPRRVGWRREIGIGEAAHRDPLDVGVPIALPKDVAACPFGQPVPLSGAAAIRAKMKADLKAAVGITLAYLGPNSVKPLTLNLVSRGALQSSR